MCHRNEDCERYSECLMVAAVHNYKTMDCSGCEKYQQMPRGKGVYITAPAGYTQPATPEYKGSIPKLNRLLGRKMREMGIPTGDFNELNQQAIVEAPNG